MGKYSFMDLAEDALRAQGRPLSPTDIWEWGKTSGDAEKVGSKGKTPWNTISAQLYCDIRDHGEASRFFKASKRPLLFGLRDSKAPDTEPGQEPPSPVHAREESGGWSEADLHPVLATFLRSNQHFLCSAKTISEKTSSKRGCGYDEWTHPDMVGVYFPFGEYQEKTLGLLRALEDSPHKLFSFELKKSLTRSTLRRCYFQAVSNSSWAHEGYLVARDVPSDGDFMDEARKLVNSFGIGVIRLDPLAPEESEIVFPSRRREQLDWEAIDGLVERNADMRKFVSDVAADIQTGMVRGRYDQTIDPDDLDLFLSRHGFTRD